MDDYVLRLLVPVAEQAIRELPDVVEALYARYPIDRKPGVGMFGFSAGGITAMLTLAESHLPVRAVADRLEKVVPDDFWPLPTYREMLFIK
jgi:dipeptidyl aminopeptidase/acylaminoacyl peptidase